MPPGPPPRPPAISSLPAPSSLPPSQSSSPRPPRGQRESTSAGALAVQAGILLSRIAGLVRERVFAHYLGLSDAAGAFSAALRIPNLLQTLFGEGALSASFIPVYARLLAEGKREEAARVARAIAALLALVVGALVLVGVLCARPLIDVIAPGFHGEVRQLTADLVQIMFPGVGLLALSAWCLGILNSHRRFFLSYVAPVLWNVAIVAALLAFGGSRMSTRAGQMELAKLIGWSTVVGAFLQLALMLPSSLVRVRRGRGRDSSSLRPAQLPLSQGGAQGNEPGNEQVRKVLRNFGPAVLSRGVVQLSAYVDQVLASYLGTAVTAAMRSAQTLYLLPVSLFGMAVSAAELPEMSGVTGSDEEIALKLRTRLESGLARIAFFVVPSAAAFLVLGDVVAATLFQTGRFHASDARLVWLVLAGSGVGLLAATQGRLIASAFWALGDTRTPLRFAVVRVALTAIAGYLLALPVRRSLGLAPGWGAAALTASAGLAAWLEYALLRRALILRIGRFSVAGGVILRCWIAALLAAGAAFALHRALPFTQPILVGAAVLGLYGVGYFGVAAALGVKEARGTIRRVTGRISRR